MNARTQLAVNGMFNKELAAMSGQAVPKNLRARQKDYELMVNRPDFRAPDGAFHKPGSLKK